MGNEGEVAQLVGEPWEEGEAGKAGAAGGQQHDTDGTGRRKAVGQLTAEEVAEADASQHYADDAGPGIDVDAELGREHAPGDQLQREAGSAGEEDDQVEPPGAVKPG